MPSDVESFPWLSAEEGGEGSVREMRTTYGTTTGLEIKAATGQGYKKPLEAEKTLASSQQEKGDLSPASTQAHIVSAEVSLGPSAHPEGAHWPAAGHHGQSWPTEGNLLFLPLLLTSPREGETSCNPKMERKG